MPGNGQPTTEDAVPDWFAILFCAMIMDRIVQGSFRKQRRNGRAEGGPMITASGREMAKAGASLMLCAHSFLPTLPPDARRQETGHEPHDRADLHRAGALRA